MLSRSLINLYYGLLASFIILMATPAAAVITGTQTGTQQREYTLELESSYGAPGKSEVLLSFPSKLNKF
jgi:hypothetical protein